MFIELKEDQLEELLAQHPKAMVQYGASWCGNCRILKPKFKKLASENDDIPFYYVDAEKLPNSRKLATVDNLPTIAAFEGGQLKNQVQTNKAEQVIALFNELKN